MAYGVLLGVGAVHGLYCAIFFSLVYFTFGTSSEACPANVATTTIMAATALDSLLPQEATIDERAAAAVKLAFMVGLVRSNDTVEGDLS
jgi:MFS superfamily sulfate permease-like transporter